MIRPVHVLHILLMSISLLTACGEDPADLVVRTDLDAAAIGPIVESFEQIARVTVEVRYDDGADADVVLADSASLTQLAADGGLTELDPAGLEAVPEVFRPESGRWVGVIGRIRTLAHDPDEVAAGQLPDHLSDLATRRWAGRIGIAPAAPGFQAFVAAMRHIDGERATRRFVEGLVTHDVHTYDDEPAVLAALESGEIALGLVDHDVVDAAGSDADAVHTELAYLPPGTAGALVVVTGVGITADGGANPQARAFVDYLMSPETQQRLVAHTGHYGLAAGAPAPPDLPTLADLQGGAGVPVDDLEPREETVALLRDVGLL